MTRGEYIEGLHYTPEQVAQALALAYPLRAESELTDVECKAALEASWCQYDLDELEDLRGHVSPDCVGAYEILDLAETIIIAVNAEYVVDLPLLEDVPF